MEFMFLSQGHVSAEMHQNVFFLILHSFICVDLPTSDQTTNNYYCGATLLSVACS